MYFKHLIQFFEEYLNIPDDLKKLCANDEIKENLVKECITLLIKGGAFTKEELREEAVKDYSIVIPHRYFV